MSSAHEAGRDPCRRTPRAITVAAVQARLRFYTSEDDFCAAVSEALAQALAHAPDLVVFPEDFGSGLVALNAPLASRARSLPAAIATVALYDPWAALRGLLSRSLSLPRALLLAAAERVRRVYVDTFSDLARRHGLHIAAGSLLLPHEGADDNAVYNTFSLFGPDGAIVGSVDKVNLIPLEAEKGLDLTPGRREDVRVWRTPVGVFGPLICYDAWDVGLARSLLAQGAQLLLVPSANPGPWTAEEQAERRNGMYARVRELGIPGVEAFGVGSFLGLPFEGQSWICAPDAAEPDGVRIIARACSADEPEIVCARVELPEVPRVAQM
ncbi:MAG: carbon-nitrogen hydrolase family protein [Armatimonadota bacterium]